MCQLISLTHDRTDIDWNRATLGQLARGPQNVVYVHDPTPRRIVAQSSNSMFRLLTTRRVYNLKAMRINVTLMPTAGTMILKEVWSRIGAPHVVSVTLTAAMRSVRIRSSCIFLISRTKSLLDGAIRCDTSIQVRLEINICADACLVIGSTS